jgi:hypothetical protein
MLDTFHFWTDVSKLEDLEPLGDRELHHLHFLDLPASPVREASALNLSADFPTEAWHGRLLCTAYCRTLGLVFCAHNYQQH